jgi:biotin carboxyl carrier protein
MRKFIINVNGKSYDVDVEEVKDGVVSTPSIQAAAPAPKAVPAAAPAAVPTAAPAPKAAAAPVSVPAGATSIPAPMPGTILSIKVQAGDKVKKGQVLCILEAMKMENEIMTGADGVISSVAINTGDSVNTGQVLFIIG